MATSTIERPAFREFVDHVTPQIAKASNNKTATSSVNNSGSGSKSTGQASSAKGGQDAFFEQVKKNINITSDDRTKWGFIGDVVSGKVGKDVDDDLRLMIVQDALESLQRMQTFLSNMLKSMHDTAMNIISNIK